MPNGVTTEKKTTRVRKRKVEEDDDDFSGGGLGNLGIAMDALTTPSERPSLLAADEKPMEMFEEDTPFFEGEQELLDSPRNFLSRRREGASRETRTRSPVNERVSNDFADILEDLEFGVDAHKISVFRLEPEYDPETGNKMAGLQATFSRPITLEDIQQQFGGGLFRIVVRGPRESSGRGSEIKAQRVVEIAGSAIPLPDPRQQAREKRKEEEKEQQLIEALLSREDRRAEESRREAMELRRELAKKEDTMLQLIAKASESKQDPMSSVLPLLENMKEENRRKEERYEAQRREEREEQRRKEEEARRHHEIEMQRQQQQFQMQMKQLEMQMQAAQLRAAEDAKSQQANMQMMVQFLTKADAEKETRNAQAQQLQMAMMQQMNDIQRTSLENQMKLVLEQANSKDDFFSGIEKFQVLQQLFNPPPEEDTRHWAEKIADRVENAVPTILGIATAAKENTRAISNAAPALAGPPRRAMPAPGSVVVVDDFADVPVEEQAALPEPESQPVEEESTDMENPLKEFPPTYQGKNATENLTELVYRLDLAVQKGLDVDEAFPKTVENLPKMQKALLKAMDADSLVGYIEENVPAEWALRSVAGEQLVRELHERLTEG
jgi:hypothetical protein